MLSPHKIHIHKAQLSYHKIHICNAQLSSQQIHIHKPQLSNQRYPTIDFQLLLFPGHCFIRCIQQRWTGLFGLYQQYEGWHQVFSFFVFLFSPFHCMLLFYLLIYFHPFIACFPLELCSRFLFFIYASLRLRFSLASLYQISLALLRQVSLASHCFLPVVLASHATWRFSLSFASFENYVT